MAELATIARPYAEALMKAAANGDAAVLAAEIRALAEVAADPSSAPDRRPSEDRLSSKSSIS